VALLSVVWGRAPAEGNHMTEKNPMAVIDRGVEWRPFIIDFDTQEGNFSFHLYAVDMPHAIERLEELKATARIVGELHGVIECDPRPPL